MHILEASSIRLQYNNRIILSDVYLKLQTGTIYGLLGLNGSGKTSLMETIFGTLQPEDGSIRLDDRHVKTLYLEKGVVSYLTQKSFLPGWLTVKNLLAYYKIEASTLEELGCAVATNKKIAVLSQNEKRLLEICIIVKCRSLFSLLDEPFAAFSPLQQERIVSLILSEKGNKGFLVSDHNWGLMSNLVDEYYFLDNGGLKLRRVV